MVLFYKYKLNKFIFTIKDHKKRIYQFFVILLNLIQIFNFKNKKNFFDKNFKDLVNLKNSQGLLSKS